MADLFHQDCIIDISCKPKVLSYLTVFPIVEYVFSIFRGWEIKKYGQQNKYGVEYGPKEFFLRCIEQLVDIIIVVWFALYFVSLSEEKL